MSFINSDSRTGYDNGVEWQTGSAGTYYYVTPDQYAEAPFGFLADYDALHIPGTGATVIHMSSYENLLGYPMVEIDVLEWGDDSATDGGDVVADALTAMANFDYIQTSEHLYAIFNRWHERGIQITALDRWNLSGGGTAAHHALPRECYLIVGDYSAGIARVAQQWSRGEVFTVHRADRDDVARMREDDLSPEDDADQGPDYTDDNVQGVYFHNGYPTLTEIQGCF